MDAVRETFNVIAFLTADVERDPEAEKKVLEKIKAHGGRDYRNSRDLRVLVDLYPGTLKLKGLKVALFTTGDASTVEAREEFGKNFSEELTRLLGDALRRHGRASFFGYRFEGVFEFKEDELNLFSEFFPVLLNGSVNNVLFITDDKLNILYSYGVLDKETLKDYLLVERTVLLQPYEYTEQMIKYVFIPATNTVSRGKKFVPSGSILFITFYSPLLRINGFKARYRTASKRRNASQLKSRKGEPFVSFHDDAIDGILSELRFRATQVPPEVEKLFKIIAIISSRKVFPMLAGYVDYAGLYGASQLIRGYTGDDYARVEDIESKIDLMLRGHLSRKYGLKSNDIRRVLSSFSASPFYKEIRRKIDGLAKKTGGFDGDPLVIGLLIALNIAREERLKLVSRFEEAELEALKSL